MQEEHAREQYFFDAPTLDRLATFVERFERPCLLCAPMLGRTLHDRGRAVATLDVDERFAHLAEFRRWDLYRPTPLPERYDLILCDPPFFNVSLSQLFTALRLLAHFDFRQPLVVSHLARRAMAVEGAFAPFALRRTDVRPTHQTVRKCTKNDIVFFTNLPEEDWFDADH